MISYYFSYLIYVKQIIEEVFDIKNEELKTKNKEQKQIAIKKVLPNKKMSFPSQMKKDEEKYDPTKKTKDFLNTKFYQQGRLKLDFSIFDYLFYFFGFFKTDERIQKKAIVDKGKLILKENLDVERFIKRFYEVEKLKIILLHHEDLQIFEQLPKPQLKIRMQDDSVRTKVEIHILKKRFTSILTNKNFS